MPASVSFGKINNASMKYLFGIPYVNRPDLLRRAVDSVRSLWPHAVILDNSDTAELGRDSASWPIPIRRAAAGVPLSFSQSMNHLLALAAESDCAALLFMHNDAEAAEGTPEALLREVERAEAAGRNWGVAFTNYDTLAAIRLKAANRIGPWDTNLPQYFADNDYYRRLRLAGWEAIETKLPVLHHNDASSTIKSDPRRNFLNGVTFPLYAEYYRRKWGGEPGGEKFTQPFDGRL